MARKPVHATCVAAPPGEAPAPGAWAVLLRGPSGAGKSDLALRLIDRGWRLVADDRTALRAAGGRLLASAPASIAGRLEVRGLGILEVPRLEEAAVCLAVDLVPGATVERLPEAETCRLAGIELPLLRLDPFEVSAPVKLNLAMHRAAAAIIGQAGVPAGGEPSAPGKKRRRDHREMPDGIAKARQAMTPAVDKRRVVLVTGVSGAGRTSALDALEDLGYEAINNPPLDLLGQIIGTGSPRPIAVGVDIRTRDFSTEPLLEQLGRLRGDPALSVNLLFVDCDDEVLRQRYSETRRRHPLARERPIIDGIGAERRLVSPLRARADLVIDTSGLRLADLGRVLSGHLGLEDAGALAVFVTSFAYRSGLPRAADLVFDVRFLDNPYYEPALRERTGRDLEVIEFVRADPGFEPFFGHLTDMLEPLLPRYQREGKSYLTIAVGCTGGRHRSVMVAEHLAPWIEQTGYKVTLVHREIGVD